MENDVLNTIKAVNGYLRDDEAVLLHKLASRCTGRGVIVEIGSWEGKSTVCLGMGSIKHSKTPVIAIDPHEGSEEHQKTFGKVDTYKNFLKNIKKTGVSAVVKPLKMTSLQAVKQVSEPVELLFIDGAHDYDSVKADFLAWSPKVIDGGTIAFHDTVSWPGPMKVVEEHIFHSGKFKKCKSCRLHHLWHENPEGVVY